MSEGTIWSGSQAGADLVGARSIHRARIVAGLDPLRRLSADSEQAVAAPAGALGVDNLNDY